MLATYPSMSECYYMMGRVYEKMEEHTTAILVIEKAVSLVKRGNRLEVNIIDLFTSLYDNYVALSPPDHHGGMRALEQVVAMFPTNIKQLFNYYHIKQYISALKRLVPLKREALRAFDDQFDKYMAIARTGVMPPLAPIRASVFAPMEEQTKVNHMFGEYIYARDKFKYQHAPVKGGSLFTSSSLDRVHRDVLRVGLVSGDVYYNHPMMHLMRTAFRYLRVPTLTLSHP